MEQQNKKVKGFTIVELIIVIAVIGVLAAILIPTFANVISKANLKSANSDAKNALTQYVSEKTETGSEVTDTLFFVKKAGKMYLFGYDSKTGALNESPNNPYDTSSYRVRGSSDMEAEVSAFLTKLEQNGEVAAAGAAQANESTGNLSESVCIWSGYSLVLGTQEAAETVNAYVTISSAGSLVLTRQQVTVYDTDGDGSLTLNDALYVAHLEHYPDGAAGYGAETSMYGFGITKLWGIANGGSYGYYVDDAAAVTGLGDLITEGSSLYAYSYADLASWSDSYSYFNVNHAEITEGESLTLTLNYLALDYTTWTTSPTPLANTELTLLGGTLSGCVTDENGIAVISGLTQGTYVFTAASVDPLITPPVCVVTVSPVS